MYDFEHGLSPTKHIVVPESQDLETATFEHCISTFIVRSGALVLASVDFDNQHVFQTNEVDDVAVKRILAAKAARAKILLP